ncbi:preprotein translocase subunit SecA [Rubritalea squalenifaciens DSM 18772]|uniref:Protein translocase subunit SecA n=1 Tax=Rubritalea squalenifaciens DSM 18772 TaxID=1123071 RepID=A0A1M6I0S7_9BACT|nr:preprotein translocase subunit SecA [Rubritalea squalenifaciens]SHJ28048.1 preprotein translocase subunit SecA [Rubritalea squalenifaciens DSM 18772]
MLKWILQKIVGNKNQRELKRLQPIVAKINEIEEALQNESEETVLAKVKEWQKHLHRYLPLDVPTKRTIESMDSETISQLANYLEDRLSALRSEYPSLPKVEATPAAIESAKKAFADIEDDFPELRAKYLDEILPEAYAVAKNAARRMCGRTINVTDNEMEWNMVHFDVQLVGGIALHNGMISEMQTGEGKTLVGTLPVFLNALTGLGVHVVTVNDYLAMRDSDWMGSLYRYLGLTVGCIQSQQPPQFRREQYQCDITYGTNAEFGFDYLRDNGMANSRDEQVQRGHYFAIIDEVDSILIDEARTPLIISGPSTISNTEQYGQFKGMIESLVKKQNVLCNELAEEAKKALEEGDEEHAGRSLFKIKLGQPRNKQLMRFMQEPDTRRLIEKTELDMYQDAQKKDLYAIKEELYYTIDEKSHDADLMDMGRNFLDPNDSESFVLPDLAEEYAEIDANLELSDEDKAEKKEILQTRLDHQGQKMHSITQLLKAYCIYEKDVEYVVEDNKVVIVDEQTGRKMEGRRWSDGLHQAVEAKEGVTVERETQTFATITIQNYFRLYEKLGGMTGTAETEAAEFHDIYNLDVLPIPTNRPNQRDDENDQVFKTRREKYNAVVKKISESHANGQPVLVGTASVDASETLSRMLKRAKIPHSVLNAKFHEQEAEIIARAGKKGAVTVSTNMAGRGTDIKLGEGVPELGGLFVIGCERYPSRRVDRQLRGRCARQGDPGKSQFYISFEDDLMRNFAAADRMTTMMERFGMEEGEALEHKWLNRSIETAQKRVEQRDYQWRKRVLDFDDVMNMQREVVYGYRNDALSAEDPRELIDEVIEEVIPDTVFSYYENRDEGSPDLLELLNWINTTFPLGLTKEEAQLEEKTAEETSDWLIKEVREAYELKVKDESPAYLDHLERQIILTAIDKRWQEHLYNMDALREGVHLRAQGQKDPLIEYKNEAYSLFQTLMGSIKEDALGNLFRSTSSLDQFEQLLQSLPQDLVGGDEPQPSFSNENLAQVLTSAQVAGQPLKKKDKPVKVQLAKRKPIELKPTGKNAPCPCGSGKKLKDCCGAEQ